MTKGCLRGFLTIVAIFMFSSIGSADEGEMKIMKQLDLTEEQRDKLKPIRKEKKAMKMKRGDVKKMRDELKTLLRGSASDSELIAKHEAIQAAKEARFKHMLKVRAILTPEQRQKFFELKEQRRKKRRGDD